MCRSERTGNQENRTGRIRPNPEGAPILTHTRFAIIIHGQTKKAVLLEVEDQLRQPLRRFLEIVDLPASEKSQGVEFVPFCERKKGVRVGGLLQNSPGK